MLLVGHNEAQHVYIRNKPPAIAVILHICYIVMFFYCWYTI